VLSARTRGRRTHKQKCDTNIFFFLNKERVSKDPDAALITVGGFTKHKEDLIEK
jgi:hypothetical protein